MALRVLCAGCSTEERERAESDVRRALGEKAGTGDWIVSLVKLQERWSVTLDGPGVRGLSCLAASGRLSEAIREALALPGERAGGGLPAGAGGSPGARRDRHHCVSCRKPFVVGYEAVPDEAEEAVPVACPHCWQLNHVLVAERAAESRDYTAEKE